MFTKPYKHKSNNTLKNSEKKQLVQRIKDEFPSMSEEKAKELVPVKAVCNCMKVVLHSGEQVSLLVVEGTPLLVDTAGGLVPTVCALWRAPDLLPTLIIHTPVLSKVLGGAPVYLPGVALPAAGAGFPMFGAGALVAAATADNVAPALIARAAMSSGDMLLRTGGVCLEPLQVYGDQLSKEPKFNKIERPKLGVALYSHGDQFADELSAGIDQLNIQRPAKEEWPSLGRREPAPAVPSSEPRPAAAGPTPAAGPAPSAGPAPHQPALIPADSPPAPAAAAHPDDTAEITADDSMLAECSQEEDSIPPDMDGLLQWCLLTFLKLEGKNVELPLKTNLLYRNHLIPLCPPDRTLDVKKSTYKKMSKFLEAMQKEGLLEVRELEKGVDAVVAAHTAHPLVRGHRVSDSVRERAQARVHAQAQPDGPQDEYAPPVVRELYCVTAHVADLLALKKGTALSAAEVRASLTEYVRARELAAPLQRGAVRLDERLAAALNMPQQEVVKWEALMSGVLGRMTPATEMVFADGSRRLSKAKLEPVKMQVATRSGNKKVTLVSNLEAFGFSLPALSHACQLGVGASCGVTRSPGAKCDQLMLQGDQTHFVAKLLIEKYKLPKKFVEGADKALNKKK